MSGGFCVNLNFNGSVVIEKILNNPTLLLLFHNYLHLIWSICTSLKHLLAIMIYNKFDWNWRNSSGEKFTAMDKIKEQVS